MNIIIPKSHEKPVINLTAPQVTALGEVCKTNGGGVPIFTRTDDNGEVEPAYFPWRALWIKDLIQGKAGAFNTVVHTKLGLQVWRAICENSSK